MRPPLRPQRRLPREHARRGGPRPRRERCARARPARGGYGALPLSATLRASASGRKAGSSTERARDREAGQIWLPTGIQRSERRSMNPSGAGRARGRRTVHRLRNSTDSPGAETPMSSASSRSRRHGTASAADRGAPGWTAAGGRRRACPRRRRSRRSRQDWNQAAELADDLDRRRPSSHRRRESEGAAVPPD